MRQESLYDVQFKDIDNRVDVGQLIVLSFRTAEDLKMIVLGFVEESFEVKIILADVERMDMYFALTVTKFNEYMQHGVFLESDKIEDKELFVTKMRMLYQYPEMHSKEYYREKNVEKVEHCSRLSIKDSTLDIMGFLLLCSVGWSFVIFVLGLQRLNYFIIVIGLELVLFLIYCLMSVKLRVKDEDIV